MRSKTWAWQLKQKWGLQRYTTLSWLSAPAFPQWVTLAKFLATSSILHFLIYETDTTNDPEVCCEDQSCSRCKVLSQVLLHLEWSLKRGCFCSSPFISVTLLNGTFSVLPDLSVKCPTNAFYTPRIFLGMCEPTIYYSFFLYASFKKVTRGCE